MQSAETCVRVGCCRPRSDPPTVSSLCSCSFPDAWQPGAPGPSSQGEAATAIPAPRSVTDLDGAFSLAVRSRELKSFRQALLSDIWGGAGGGTRKDTACRWRL